MVLLAPLAGSPKFQVNFVSLTHPLSYPKIVVLENKILEVTHAIEGAVKFAIGFDLVFPPTTVPVVLLHAFVTTKVIMKSPPSGQLLVV